MSKNNFKERVRKMEPKQERFSIRKFTVGAASVLIGFTFFMNGGQKAQAAEQNASSDNTNQESEKAASDESSSKTEQAVSDQQSQNKVNDISDSIDQLKATGGKKSDVQAKAAQIQNQIDALSDAEKTALAAKQGATDSAASTTAAASDEKAASSDAPKAADTEDLTVSTKSLTAATSAKTLAASAVKAAITTSTATQTSNVSDWAGFVSPLEDVNVGTINVTSDITVTGKTGNLGGQSLGYNGCLTLSDKNIARTVTINGNGNTIDFGHYSLMFEDANQKNESA